MSSVLPNMGLITWPSGADLFNHTELAATFALIDAHDHTSTKGVQIPAGGIAAQAVGTTQLANLGVTTTKIADANVTTAKITDANVTLAKMASNSVDSSKIVNASVADADLASPTNVVWKTIMSGHGMVAGGSVTGAQALRSGAALTDTSKPALNIELIPTDLAVTGLTTKLRVYVTAMVNNTAPGQDLVIGLYALAIGAGGGSGVITYTLSTVQTSATFTLTANALGNGSTTEITIPAIGHYIIGVNPAGTTAAASMVDVGVLVQVRNT